MKIKDFKAHKIVRSSPSPRNDYKEYREDLKTDFCDRCAYCNLKNSAITTPFEIDHFIPRVAFKDKRPSLETDYNNLVYACKKCNTSKSGKYMGNVLDDNPTNELFYDPVIVDYNTIFYRNEFGAIESDDAKGKQMIQHLKLYRPIHILGWLCEEINLVADKLQVAIDCETNPEKKKELTDALANVNSQYRKYNNLFIASYNDNSFELSASNT